MTQPDATVTTTTTVDAHANDDHDGVIEQLAAIEHERWADWQGYLHSKLQRNEDGSLTIPAGYVAALERLIVTPYAELSEDQKENDRREVRRYLHLVKR